MRSKRTGMRARACTGVESILSTDSQLQLVRYRTGDNTYNFGKAEPNNYGTPATHPPLPSIYLALSSRRQKISRDSRRQPREIDARVFKPHTRALDTHPRRRLRSRAYSINHFRLQHVLLNLIREPARRAQRRNPRPEFFAAIFATLICAVLLQPRFRRRLACGSKIRT